MNQPPTTITTGRLAVTVAADFGPRITSLVPSGGPNLLAVLGDLGLDFEGGRYVFRGGHRLWAAPEIPGITYVPDNVPVQLRTDDNRIVAISPETGIGKAIDLIVKDDWLEVTHTVTNHTEKPIELAPWAITQLRPGGTALLPIDVSAPDAGGLQASTTLVGWPYTDWGALEYDAAAHVLCLTSDRDDATKIGASLRRGWLGYIVGGWLFVKYAQPAPQSAVDLGAQAEIYVCPDFVELETLGPSVLLEPGQSTNHMEKWQVVLAPDGIADAANLADSQNPWKESR